jgi:hypothetical protein
MPAASAADVLDRHLRERPDAPRLTVRLDDVPGHIKRVTEEIYFWRALRGGLTEAEFERQFALARANEKPGADPELRKRSEEMVRGMVRGQATGFLDDRFRERFLEESNLSAQRWEEIEDRILFVYDAADPQRFVWIFEPADETSAAKQLTDASDAARAGDAQKSEAFSGGSFRQQFARRVAQLPPERRPERIGQVTIRNSLAEGVADVYVRPRSAEDQ